MAAEKFTRSTSGGGSAMASPSDANGWRAATGGDILEQVRAAAAKVAATAEQVRVVEDRIGPYAAELGSSGVLDRPVSAGDADPWAVPDGEVEGTVGLVLALDAVNFGSGWHPLVQKREGRSGAVTMATNLREWVDTGGGVDAAELATFTPQQAHEVFRQPFDDGPVDDLMALFATALVDLGRLVVDQHDGSFTSLVRSADGSAAALVETLRTMPLFDDVATHHGRRVPILKRAQLAAADLHRSLGNEETGRFDDLDRLTAFADNLVPHVLRLDGVLRYDDDLVARINEGELLESGSPEEVEIRAVGLHAVELIVSALADRGQKVPPWHLDYVLWARGGGPEYKAVPRHRARSVHY